MNWYLPITKTPSNTFNTDAAGGTPHLILVDDKDKEVQSLFGSDPNNTLLQLDLKIN